MGRVVMFTGKGGVGKTTCSAATALHYAALGPTLVISTDVTPSLSHIFELAKIPAPAPVRPQLYVKELGQRDVRELWDARFGREVYEVFSAFVDIDYPSFVEFMTSVLPGLGEEFMVDFIREMAQKGAYETIVWDTAPLGQTLGLLATPALLADHLRLAPRVYSRLKLGRGSREPVLDILRRWERLSAEDMAFLRHEVDFTMVTIPEALAVEQLEGTFREMERYGLRVRRMIINNVVKSEESDFLTIKAGQQRAYLEHIYQTYGHLDITELPMFPREIKGLERLREVEKILYP
jgi:arsenite-transporting ATPase